ncbi:MAG TPA: hypothetical protein VJ994_02895 [Paracoccaceae bacterium]|nr:hypothetical protein [Paracoccaceae bacterium]
MPRTVASALVAATLALAACAAPPPEPPREFRPVTGPGEFIEKVAGKPITFENGGVLIANPDGSFAGNFDGVTPTGSWTFTGGQLCRVVTVGSQEFPRVCNLIEASDDVVRFLNPDGTLSAEAKLG